MRKLLRANFLRLLKNKAFQIGALLAAGIGIFADVSRYLDVQKHPDIYTEAMADYYAADTFVFLSAEYVIFIMAIVIGLFIGTEYSDGTMRNKIVAGHRRADIFIANYIVCASAAVFMLLVSDLATILVGKLLFSTFYLPAAKLLAGIGIQCIAMLSFTAIMVLFSMLIPGKAGASVTVLLLTMLFLMGALTISRALSQPQYREEFVSSGVDDATGDISLTPRTVKNPNYLNGMRRTVYTFLNDVLPVNQMLLEDGDIENLWGKTTASSLIIILMCCGGGAIVFERRDLK